jgi:hypothetical protein
MKVLGKMLKCDLIIKLYFRIQLVRLKLIETSWDENNKCDNGLNAMFLANEIYEKKDNVELTDMPDIVNYNEVDCKVLYEIITYLRKNH